MATKDFKRKLSAILSADVAGYSRLMGEDEAATVEAITTYRGIMGGLIRQHRGRVVDSPGDNLLAEFASVVDAVQCAVAVQKEFQARNAELPENRRMDFRIGINLGDVIEEEDRIYGDGVNIAARLEALADQGGICVSKTAFDQIETKLPLGYEYLGDQTVKNIAKPVGAYRVLMEPRVTVAEEVEKEKRVPIWRRKAILAGGVALALVVIAALIWNFYFRPPPIEPASVAKMAYPLPEKPSIAVLPFANLSKDPKQEYLADAITENIISVLSRVPKMFVVARNSTFTFKGKPVKVKRVAEEFGVQYVLEGSVQRSGDRIRITAQLIDALNGRHLWSDRYERKLKDIFALQDDIAREVLRALQVKLTAGEGAAFRLKYEPNIDVYLKHLQAREYAHNYTKDDNIKARKMAEEIISLDPKYAGGYGLLATVELQDVWLGISKSPKKSLMRGVELAKKSIAIEDNPGAHRLLANIYLLFGKHAEAIAEAKKIIELVPNGAGAHITLGAMLAFADRGQEAIPILEKGIRLSPLPQTQFLHSLAFAYFLLDKYEEGIEAAKAAVRIQPKNALGRRVLVACYAMAGREEDARAEALEALRLAPNFTVSGAQSKKGSSIKNKDQRKKYYDALRRGGLPDKPPLPLPDKPSIAVLPFVNMSGDPEQEYFSDGISEEIITALSKTPQLFVIARTSSFKYKGKEIDVRTVGRELGVRYVLEGSIRKAGDKVRVTAQLIDAQTNKHLWAERYDRELKDIFAIQDGITIKIMTALQVQLTEGEQARLIGKGTNNLDAYLNYLKARDYLNQFTKETNMLAKQLAEKTISLDPNFAYGYVGLGMTHIYDVWLGVSKSPKESFKRAIELAQKAIEIDPSLYEPHRLLAHIYVSMRRYDTAIAEAEKALELNPNSAHAYATLGHVLLFAGKPEEAIPMIKKAIRLNPYPPSWYYANLAGAYKEIGHYDEAIQMSKKGLEKSPDNLMVLVPLTGAYVLAGRLEEAKATAKEVLRVNPRFSVDRYVRMSPFKDESRKIRNAEALRKAGLK